jgi:Fe-S-cluster containining protein
MLRASVDETPPKIALGPAARARREGRDYNIKIMRNAMAPLANDDGTPRNRGPAPYLPVLQACDICPGRCCRLNVKVSLPDAIHYCTTLGLPFFAGMMLVPSPHAAHAFKVERDPRVNPETEGWLGTCEIQLRRKEDGSCHALTNIGGYERCGVYAARPSLCRLYPFIWTSDVAKGNPGMILCPVPYAVTEAEERKALKDIERSIENWELHDAIVAEWHAQEPPQGRTVEAFLCFAVPRTASILGIAYGEMLAPGAPNQRLFDAMLRSGVIRPSKRNPNPPGSPGAPGAG